MGHLPSHPLLLSVDFEDWHQLVRRRLGVVGWETPGPGLARQTSALLDLLDELEAKATFFVLGITARAHPRLVLQIAERGHEIGCHGDRHLPVCSQAPLEFARDLRAARETIESVCGRRPLGYRAPAFSITRSCRWAYEVLAAEGFAYDSSQHDSPRIRGRVVPARAEPHPLAVGEATVWEFPVAVWRTRRLRLPVGGASYWAVMPTALVLRGLELAGPFGGLYLHPHELDPQPLRVGLPARADPRQRVHGRLRSLERNLARRRAPEVLRAIAQRHQLIPYGEAYAKLAGGP
jgi:polysaccharide deacetylase family protein (PEP-CTERM system associated)